MLNAQYILYKNLKFPYRSIIDTILLEEKKKNLLANIKKPKTKLMGL